MITSDDRLFCLLLSAEQSISVKRLSNCMYIFQKVGFDLGYKFRLNVSGVKSKSFSAYLEEQVAEGIILQSHEGIELPRDSDISLYSFPLTFREISVVESLCEIIDSLTDAELHLVCVTDIMISDVESSKCTEDLVSKRQFIETSVSNLCSNYSKDNFNMVMQLLCRLRKDYRLN